MESEERMELKDRIVDRLEACDEHTLRRVDEVLDLAEERGAEAPVLFSDGISRGQFLAGLAAGGAVLVSTNLATGMVAGSLGTKAGQATAQMEAEVELLKLRGLVTLYENLEQVGLDALLSTGLLLVSASLQGLESGITVLESGVRAVDAGVTAFELSFPTIRRGLIAVENVFSGLEARLARLEELMGEVQEMVSPLSDAVGSFFSSIVERIPRVGPAMLDALDRISDLVGSLPDAIGEVKRRLLEPLREEWFTDDDESGLKGKLLNPIQERLLEPLESFLSDLADAVDTWQQRLLTPAEQALTEREIIREQIVDYKEREGIA
jgi:hypothetical protein